MTMKLNKTLNMLLRPSAQYESRPRGKGIGTYVRDKYNIYNYIVVEPGRAEDGVGWPSTLSGDSNQLRLHLAGRRERPQTLKQLASSCSAVSAAAARARHTNRPLEPPPRRHTPGISPKRRPHDLERAPRLLEGPLATWGP